MYSVYKGSPAFILCQVSGFPAPVFRYLQTIHFFLVICRGWFFAASIHIFSCGHSSPHFLVILCRTIQLFDRQYSNVYFNTSIIGWIFDFVTLGRSWLISLMTENWILLISCAASAEPTNNIPPRYLGIKITGSIQQDTISGETAVIRCDVTAYPVPVYK